MSQITLPTTAGNLPPSVPTSFVTDAGTAIPVANVLNVVGGPGINTSGSGSTVTVNLNGALSGTGTTIGAVTADVITFAAGAVPGTYQFDIRVAGFDATVPQSCGYGIIATARTTGAAASIIGTPDKVVAEEGTLSAANADVVASGNNIIVRVLGIAVDTVRWKADAVFTFRS